LKNPKTKNECVFRSVVAITFQNAFHLQIYQNNIFYFLKIIFDISASKWFSNTKKKYLFKVKKKINKIQIFSKVLLKC